MTFLLFALGAVGCALGTRLAALPLTVAAVLAARADALQPVAVWTAALAAGLVVLSRTDVRGLALPILGAASVLVAATAPNAAVVFAAWLVGTIAVVLRWEARPASHRWTIALCASDVLLAVAIATTVGGGFEGWPGTLGPLGSALLVASAVARIPLASGPDPGSRAELLVVRAQAAVLIAIALPAGGTVLSMVVVVLAVLGFASALVLPRGALIDVVQELSLVGIALASERLGWGPRGWAWGALAAGTLIHYLSFTERGHAEPFAQALARSAGIGLPFLPVVAALVEGATHDRGILGVLIVLGLLAGMAGRARAAVPPRRPPRRTATTWDEVRTAVPTVLALAAAVSAPLLSLPRPPGGSAVSWPPAWGAVLVVLVGVAGSAVPGVVTVTRPPARAALRLAPLDRFASRIDSSVERFATSVTLRVALGLLGAAAVALWAFGLGRGFL